MPHYCTNCQINWAKLESHDCDGDESYEVCPICKTDTFLTEGKESDAFIMSMDGAIINPKTGEDYRRYPPSKNQTVTAAKAAKNYFDIYDKRADREDIAIEMYQQALAAGMLEEDAKEIYRAKMAKG